MFRSIHWRIALPFIVLVALTMLALGGYLSALVKQAQMEDLRTELFAEARLIVDALSLTGLQDASAPTYDELAHRWARLLEVRVTLIGRDGTVLGESHEDSAQMDNHLARPEIQQAIAEGQGSSIRRSDTLGDEMLYVALPLEVGGQTEGFARLALPLSALNARIVQLQRAVLAAALLAGAFAVLLAAVIAERTTRPLRSLTEAAQRISAGELHGKLSPPTRDEVGDLTQAFNRMALNLQTQIEALETERGKLAAVLQQMSNGVIIVDPGGQVILLNPSAARMFATSSEQALDHSLVEVLRHYKLVELWEQARATRLPQTNLLELGVQRTYLQVVATPLDGALAGHILLIFQDLTRLRRLETVRKDFISNISHELRTPLASLKALAETLLGGALEDPPAARRFLSRMETEVDALALMVQELLELSQIESGKVPLQLEPAAPEDLLRTALERLHLQAQNAGVTVDLACPPGLPLVLADPPRMQQVLMNLLHNAIKFTPPGGQIALSAHRQGGEVIFQVQDSGVGISPEVASRIFERFYKADKARSSGGTGLGLAIARHLVEAHGGRIWAESSPGTGSVFRFSLPVSGHP